MTTSVHNKLSNLTEIIFPIRLSHENHPLHKMVHHKEQPGHQEIATIDIKLIPRVEVQAGRVGDGDRQDDLQSECVPRVDAEHETVGVLFEILGKVNGQFRLSF